MTYTFTRCGHPEATIITIGSIDPDPTWRDVRFIEWCAICGAYRTRNEDTGLAAPWRTPKGPDGEGIKFR